MKRLLLILCLITPLGCGGAIATYEGASFEASVEQVDDTVKVHVDLVGEFTFVGLDVIAGSHYLYDGVGHLGVICVSAGSSPKACIKARKTPGEDAEFEWGLEPPERD